MDRGKEKREKRKENPEREKERKKKKVLLVECSDDSKLPLRERG
jgi:hypothetical protein